MLPLREIVMDRKPIPTPFGSGLFLRKKSGSLVPTQDEVDASRELVAEIRKATREEVEDDDAIVKE